MGDCRRGRYIKVNDCVSGHIADHVQLHQLMTLDFFSKEIDVLDYIFRCTVNPPLLEKEGTYSHIICPLIWFVMRLRGKTDFPEDWMTYGTPSGVGLDRPSGATGLVTRCDLRTELYKHPAFLKSAFTLLKNKVFCASLEGILTGGPVYCQHAQAQGVCEDPEGPPDEVAKCDDLTFKSDDELRLIADRLEKHVSHVTLDYDGLLALVTRLTRQLRGNVGGGRKSRKSSGKPRKSKKNRKASRKNRSRKH